MDSHQPILAGLTGFLIGGVVADAAEPVIFFIGGGGSVGVVLRAAWEVRKTTPDWERATGRGAVEGALVGSVLLIVDALSGG